SIRTGRSGTVAEPQRFVASWRCAAALSMFSSELHHRLGEECVLCYGLIPRFVGDATMFDLPMLRAGLRSEGGVSRRLFLAYGAALAAVPAVGGRVFGGVLQRPRFAADPFSLGVASGDPTDTGVVLWTRLAPLPLDEAGGMP